MTITVKSNLKGLTGLHAKLKGEGFGRDPVLTALSRAMMYERSYMEMRTKRGKGKNERAFANNEYSDSYRKKREKLGKPVDVVDLTWDNKMLKSMQASGKKRNQGLWEGKINIAPSEVKKAKAAIADGREFFGLSKKQYKRIKQDVDKELKPDGRR